MAHSVSPQSVTWHTFQEPNNRSGNWLLPAYKPYILLILKHFFKTIQFVSSSGPPWHTF
jgi:hypothetical protein